MSFKDYLPSRAFQKRVLAIVIIIAIVVAIFFAIKLVRFLIEKRSLNKQIRNLPVELQDQVNILTIGDLQKKDSNNNSIPDWEERLYGLDPLRNGEENKKIILEKRAELQIENGDVGPDNGTGSETEKFAKEFISLVLSLEGSGALSDNALSNISTAASNSLSDYTLPDVLSSWDVKTVDMSVVSRDKYVNTLLTELSKISDTNGSDELGVIANSIAQGKDDTVLISGFSGAYRRSAESLRTAFVPKEFLAEHLAIVNSLDHIATGLDNMKYISTDPARSSRGIAQYQVYSETLSNAVQDIQEKY